MARGAGGAVRVTAENSLAVGRFDFHDFFVDNLLLGRECPQGAVLAFPEAFHEVGIGESGHQVVPGDDPALDHLFENLRHVVRVDLPEHRFEEARLTDEGFREEEDSVLLLPLPAGVERPDDLAAVQLGEGHKTGDEVFLDVIHDVLECQEPRHVGLLQVGRQKHLCLFLPVVCHFFLPLAFCPRHAGFYGKSFLFAP